MATYSISGSVGISNVGVSVRCINLSTGAVTYGYALSDGTYSFAGLADATVYRIIADTRDITSGVYVGYVYRHPLDVYVKGANVTNANLTPTAANATS